MLSRTGRMSRCVQGVAENHREGGGMMMQDVWRRLGIGLVTLVLIGSLAGALPARAAKVLTFAVVPKAINNPFFNDVRRGCEAEARKLGIRCEYTGPTVTEIQPQIQVLEALIQRHVDGMAISAVDGKAVVPVIKRAMAAGIPVVTFDADAAPGSGRLAFIGTNNYRGGVALGKAFAKGLPAGGRYAIITGGLGAEDLKQALKSKVEAMKSGKFAMVSFDTLKPELQLLKAGYVTTLVGQRPYKMGADSMDALYDYLTKKVTPRDPTDTGLDIVDRSNVDRFLANAGG